MTTEAPRHKVFISYHHEEDQEYKNRLVQALAHKSIDMSVPQDEIQEDGIHLDEIRRIIRDEHIADATVAIVLIGKCSWQRKHVDWEISASLIDRRNNPRCGLLGLLLPTHPDYRKRPDKRNHHLIPPRLADNILEPDPFAAICDWPKNGLGRKIAPKIHDAFLRRNKQPDPDNSRRLFGRNWSGDCRRGWKS